MRKYYTEEAVLIENEEFDKTTLLSERNKAIRYPQMGDIWFTDNVNLPSLGMIPEEKYRLFIVHDTVRDESGCLQQIIVRHWSGNPQADIEQSMLRFSSETKTIEYAIFLKMMVEEKLEVSRMTEYRLQYEESAFTSVKEFNEFFNEFFGKVK